MKILFILFVILVTACNNQKTTIEIDKTHINLDGPFPKNYSIRKAKINGIPVLLVVDTTAIKNN